ncbi:MAG: potassium channel family protein [Candidatus Muirbacterium halophilum]|nr:potassium channel family protein [Candidatus Muirbacterium halophilum]
MDRIKQLKLALLYVLMIVGSGVAGFMLIEKWKFIDSLYMTIITLTTVGFSEIHPISQYGRVFVILLILSGIGVATYFVSLITSFIVDGEFRNILRRKKMEDILKELNNHYIVCGSGKIAHEAVNEMKKKGKSIVLIDEKADNDSEVEIIDKNLIRIKGDPTEDKILEMAKIRKATALLVATDNDANNLYITLTARQANSTIYIVSHAERDSSMDKFRKAGANRVISIIGLGAKRMAS